MRVNWLTDFRGSCDSGLKETFCGLVTLPSSFGNGDFQDDPVIAVLPSTCLITTTKERLNMGGDGGVIAANRRFMRGAGTANHTADASRNRDKPAAEKEVMKELFDMCYLTKNPLDYATSAIVVDPYGRLYHKEAGVEALLRRKQRQQQEQQRRQQSSTTGDELGEHIRGLKDLKDVRFQLSGESMKPSCPVTGIELNGYNVAFLIPQRKEGVNVISERAIKVMGIESLQGEYGKFEQTDLIRIAPPPSMMEEIEEKVKKLQAKQKAKKDRKRKNKKCDDEDNSKKPSKKKQNISSNDVKGNKPMNLSNAVERSFQSQIQDNKALSSLFTKEQKAQSAGEKAANLFARI